MYAISVTSGKETQVLNEIKKLEKITAYVPKNTLYIRRGGVWRTEERILIPGYIFIECRFGYDMYYKIKGITHVHSWLGRGTPYIMNEADKKFIEFMANGGKPIPPQDITGEFLRGTVIKEIDKRRRRIKVSFEIFGKIHTVSFGYREKIQAH